MILQKIAEKVIAKKINEVVEKANNYIDEHKEEFLENLKEEISKYVDEHKEEALNYVKEKAIEVAKEVLKK